MTVLAATGYLEWCPRGRETETVKPNIATLDRTVFVLESKTEESVCQKYIGVVDVVSQKQVLH